MLRRSHKKSRRGCTECKQRHVKCDESRPACRLCTVSGRNCSFTSQAPTKNPLSSSQDARPKSPVDSRSSSSGVTPVPDATPPVPTFDADINLEHMELLIHLTVDKGVFNLGDDLRDTFSTLPIALKTGLEAPYLLYQLLAFSARHLAFLNPDRTPRYLHQAVTLQTRAVSLFNTTRAEVNRSNCVAILLFSVALGHHLLADSLCKREPGGLEGFLAHYVQCIEMNRSIYTIVQAAWPLLLESELEPILSWSSGNTSQPPRGNHCQHINELIEKAQGLSQEEREACQTAINYLQLGFDALPDGASRFRMIFTWTMLAPPEVTNLLAIRRPEVLILLSYYALLLHYGRSMWQVGDAGVYILGLIEGYLGSEWHEWLEYPRSAIMKDLE
ncbi:Zn(2)-C6 fungal-type domain-containing protein [Fusarium sp. Ph1]|nr:Zn(2)-C6 fungal-type domain-containing protein [Fusarium sp. Ph1]